MGDIRPVENKGRAFFMIISQISGVRIAGIAAAVSNNWTSLCSFKTKENAESIDKFIRMTGIQGRYDAGIRQTTADFCYVASRNLLEMKGLKKSEIGALIFISQTSDYLVPATACILQHRLGLPKDCIAFDVNLGCSGFVYGMNIIASLMMNSNIENALLLVGDTVAKEKKQNHIMKSYNSHKMLFGDAGAAILLEKSESATPISGMLRTDGSGYKAIIRPFGHWRNPNGADDPCMDDIAVFNFTISEVPKMVKEFMVQQSTTSHDYDCFVPHQANLYILKQIAKKIDFPLSKMLVSIDKYGNTSSASIPLTLVNEYGEQEDGRQINALMCGFGVGLSWGIVAAKIEPREILPIIHSDEYFEDGY